MKTARVLVVITLLLTLVPLLRAQSLAEAAKKERERRKRIDKPVTVITNENLGKSQPGKGFGYVEIQEASEPYVAPGGDPFEKAAQEKELWQRRLKDAKSVVQEAQAAWEKAMRELEDLNLERLRSQDPNLQMALPQKISEKERDIQERAEALKEAQRSLDDLYEEARRKGVPPGYLR